MLIVKIYEDHAKWINTTLKFGCTKEEAEDIVGDMYLIIGKMLNKGLDITYGDQVNYYYIYKTLKTSYLQLYNKKKKQNNVPLDLVVDLTSGEYINYDEKNNIVVNELETMHWYDKKVFELIQNEYSITELSNKTNISYHSLYNTYRKTKQKLIKKALE
tara:strand:+ start:352 stop:828 length:477 start_codon:yes stop_codon:yes gene_type:complete